MSKRLNIYVLEKAEQDILLACEWWEKHRPEARDKIGEELERVFKLISLSPRIGARARNTAVSGVYRVYLARVHYYLYYRISSRGIEVLAFWQSSRGSAPNL